MRDSCHANRARQHLTKMLQSVAYLVGAGKTVAIRAALSSLDGSRHIVIYLPNPTVGVRGIHHQSVAALGAQPLVHHATLVPQTVEALAVEQSEKAAHRSWCSTKPTSWATTSWNHYGC